MKIDLIQIRLPLVHFFETSFGRQLDHEAILVRVERDDIVGWGECPAGGTPGYSYETVGTAWYVLNDFLVPRFQKSGAQNPWHLPTLFHFVRGHPMAKAAIEMALWDLHAKTKGTPLSKELAQFGGLPSRPEIPTGISLGIENRPEDLMTRIQAACDKGYRRIKVKVKPGWDIDILQEIRREFPRISLMADANSAYSLSDTEHLKRFDAFDLMMIEQPLDYEDLVDHASLQRRLKTPICLDESIRGPEDGRRAAELGACRIVNIKQARVGGPSNAVRLHTICAQRGIPVWCGGLLESGIGRAHNIALASLPNFSLPGDISASERYYAEDLIDPPVIVSPTGTITVPRGPGIGYTVVEARVAHHTVRRVRLA